MARPVPSDMPEPVFGRTAGGLAFLAPWTEVLGDAAAVVVPGAAGVVVVTGGVVVVAGGVLGGVLGMPVQMCDNCKVSPDAAVPSPG